MKDRFYLVSLRDTVGSNTAFHSHHGRGYSTDQRNARVARVNALYSHAHRSVG
ncbi:hypothetical protein OGV35_13145 [Citrobacter sp. Cb016]|uniref:hypothetical protein n=1 Tax=Citrobacter sp. Cb016 TaxID=2985015 RepID=UPI0015E571DA|nr:MULTISPECIES: hypothetical protein [Enterobacteriaceae]MDM3398690.1 hypothetical protein [Citrobacter sp. Cb016]QLO06645.1 hypothetical protein HV141_25850 [Citrobacter freundii]VVY58837.1 Uncharacterised protein [Escherichia coli]VVZ62988.1 Uncharacterised protein [Escherichia coli]VWN02901.1 Uncharacterised protein [Escherichia coli]